MLIRKEELGAKFATTQFFFESNKWHQLVERLAKRGSNLPIIAGILPITNLNQLNRMTELSGLQIPKNISKRFEGVENSPEDVRKILEQAAKDTQPFVYKRAAEMEVSLLKVVTDFGVKVNTANREAFVKASDPIYKEFATDVKSGATLVSKILELAKAK